MNDTKISGTVARVLRIPLRTVNSYLVQSERGAVLVDTGFPGATDTILKKLSERGVDPEEISLIVLTHGHPDHAGSAAELRKRLRVPVAIHALEAGWMRSGLPEIHRPIRAFGRLIKPLLRPKYRRSSLISSLRRARASRSMAWKERFCALPGTAPAPSHCSCLAEPSSET